MTNTTEMNVTVSAPADVKTTRLECDGKLNLTPVSAPVDVKTTKPTKKALFTALLALVTETAPENAEILTAFINSISIRTWTFKSIITFRQGKSSIFKS